MKLKKQEKIIVLVNILAILFFAIFFVLKGNYEFLLYLAILIILMALVFWSHRFFHYSTGLLWALTIWGLLHLIGGGLEYTDGQVFYNLILFPIVGEPYSILKYDQALHFFGFWATAILAFYLIKPSLKDSVLNIKSIILVIIMTSLGLSAVNEIVEFVATVLIPETNVGGYENTAIDLVSNLLGAIGAGIYLKYKYFPNKQK